MSEFATTSTGALVRVAANSAGKTLIAQEVTEFAPQENLAVGLTPVLVARFDVRNAEHLAMTVVQEVGTLNSFQMRGRVHSGHVLHDIRNTWTATDNIYTYAQKFVVATGAGAPGIDLASLPAGRAIDALLYVGPFDALEFIASATAEGGATTVYGVAL